MKTIREVDKLFYEELDKLQKKYRDALEELLKENGLNNGVVRIKDGKEGVLVAEKDLDMWLGYELKFYPITKAGELSKKASFYYYLEDFKPRGADK